MVCLFQKVKFNTLLDWFKQTNVTGRPWDIDLLSVGILVEKSTQNNPP